MENRYEAGNPRLNGSDKLIVVTGCSGGGKSKLLAEMARRGYAVMPEPGRQIVREEQFLGGDGLPWENAARFAELCISRGVHFYHLAQGVTFFDRSCLDNIAALERADVPLTATMQGVLARLRYAHEVFCVPPWAEIFGQDAERKHSFEAAVEEYEYLTTFYAGHGYEVTLVPKLDVAARADWLEGKIK